MKTFYNWRNKFGEMASSELRGFRQLRQENQKLKSLVADLSLDRQILRDALGKKRGARCEVKDCAFERVFLDGKQTRNETLREIRARIRQS